MATYPADYAPENPRDLSPAMQKNMDMHAGNERVQEPAKDQPGEQIDWDAHKRFMRGL